MSICTGAGDGTARGATTRASSCITGSCVSIATGTGRGGEYSSPSSFSAKVTIVQYPSLDEIRRTFPSCDLTILLQNDALTKPSQLALRSEFHRCMR